MSISKSLPIVLDCSQIFDIGVNRKFDFKQGRKFSWDLRNEISGGNRLFRLPCNMLVGPHFDYACIV